MLSRERVIQVIRHDKPDRIPLYGWVRFNLEKQIGEAFGSVEAFEDRYEFDLSHLWGNPWTFTDESLAFIRGDTGEPLPERVLQAELHDPDDESKYAGIAGAVRHHKTGRGRFVYVQTPGFFEFLNGTFGIENQLLYLLMYRDEIHEVYRRQAAWNARFAMNCLDLGVDMIHISDDWGGQQGLLFDPQLWWDLIFPNMKTVVDAVKARGAFVSLHSDGNISPIMDGIVRLGFDVLHPYQESAGMDLALFKERYRRHLTIMGGLDVQTTMGFGNYGAMKAEIERVTGMFRDGGLIFCTSHFVQDHCSIDELKFAFDTAYEMVRRT